MNRKLVSRVTKAAALAVSAAMLSVLVIAGTYAWTDRNQHQHKTNELEGVRKVYDVTLIEDFRPEDNWKTGETVVKEVRVKNTADTSKLDGGAVYVRLTFKEYMEIASQSSYVYTQDRYAVGTDGKFIYSAVESDEAWLAAQGYAGHEYSLLTNALTDETGYYIKTDEGDINGQYGKCVITGATALGGATPVIAGTQRVDPTLLEGSGTHNGDHNGECGYPAYNLADPDSGITHPIHEYALWNHDENYVVPLSRFNGQRNVWVYNDVNTDDCYVYWIGALAPGETTQNAMDSVELLREPSGEFYYAIHVDMEAVSENCLAEWTDVPAEILAALSGGGTP
jgi:hypothetical protein